MTQSDAARKVAYERSDGDAAGDMRNLWWSTHCAGVYPSRCSFSSVRELLPYPQSCGPARCNVRIASNRSIQIEGLCGNSET